VSRSLPRNFKSLTSKCNEAINQAGVYAISAILILFSTAAFGLRVGARRLKRAPLKSDDYLSGLATVCSRQTSNISFHSGI
jgi:hypothetical protein